MAVLIAVTSSAQAQQSLPDFATEFINADVNGDGVITRNEATALLTQAWDSLDQDNDNTISVDEQKILLDYVQANSGKDPKAVIDRYLTLDQDNNGLISAEEIDSRFHSLITRADQNDDAAVSAQELIDMLSQ